MLGLAFCLACAALACSSNSVTRESRDFSDAAGRACQATLEKTSTSAAAVSESVACDGQGKQCSSSSLPCFELSVTSQTDGYQIRNCPACCKGGASSFFAADCSALVCSSDSDCVFAEAKCQDGVCTCPSGFCG